MLPLVLGVLLGGSDVLWTGGGVTLWANYSYSVEAPLLTGGAYAMSCGGQPVPLLPTGRHRIRGGDGGTAAASITVDLAVSLPPPRVPSAGTDAGDGACTAGTANSDIGGEKDMLRLIRNATAATCCAACLAEQPRCNAWALSTASDGTFAPGVCFLVAAASGATYVPSKTRAAQLLPPSPSPPPPPPPAPTYCNGTRAEATFAATADGAVLFTLTFPDGVPLLSNSSAFAPAPAPATAPTTAPSTAPPTAAALPAGHGTAFPLWASPLVDPGVGWLTWGAEQFFPASWGGGPGGGTTTGAPIVLFDARESSSATSPSAYAAVLSTADEHFTCGCVLSDAGGFGCGVLGAVPSLPAGYASASLFRTVVAVSGNSSGGGGGGGGAAPATVTAAVLGWGASLQALTAASARASAARQLVAAADIVTTKLGYWTDNQAYYDWYHWFPDVTKDGTPQDVLLALDAELGAKNLSVAYYQLDAYWYKLEIAPGYCVREWVAVADQFPRGLAWLSEELGRRSSSRRSSSSSSSSSPKPLLLYTDTWCADTAYRAERGGNWTFMDGDAVSLSWFKGNTSNVVPEQAYPFYRWLLGEMGAARQGMGAFEVDFLNFNFKLYPRFRGEPGAHGAWLDGIDRAAREVGSGVSVQYCMALPQQLLHAAGRHTQTTSARVAPDGGRPYYDGAAGQLLAAALGVRPFKDNVWTSGRFPKGAADIVGSVLTMGPLGLADARNATNATLAAAACARDGTLLHPSRPATPLDATFLPSKPLGAQGSIETASYGPAANGAATHAAVAANADADANANVNANAPSPPWWHAIAVSGVGSPGRERSIAPGELWPPVSGAAVWWHGPAPGAGAGGGCAVGAPVAGCLFPFSAAAPARVAAAAGEVELFHVAPVLPGGWVVLGETRKVVPVAAARFASIKPLAGGGLSLRLVGSEGEHVEVLFGQVGSGGSAAAAAAVVASRTVVLPASGAATVTIP